MSSWCVFVSLHCIVDALTLLNALTETLAGIIYFLMEFFVAHLLQDQVALKNHLYKSCLLSDRPIIISICQRDEAQGNEH